VGLRCWIRSCCDLVLVGESAEDRSAAHLVIGEVDHWWGLGFGLGRCELSEGSVGPCVSDVVQIDREDPVQVAFVDDQDPVEQLTAQGCDHAFADRVRPGRSGWTGEDPDALCGEDRVECLGEPAVSVSEQERYACGAVGDVPQQIPGGLGGPCTGRVRGHSCQRCPATTVLDRDQGVDSSQHHGVYVHEIHGQDGLSLGGEELARSESTGEVRGRYQRHGRICHPGQAAMRWPSRTNSPCTLWRAKTHYR
jgi:hypothetical protein